MLSIETAIRLLVIGQQLLVAAIFLSGSGNRAARQSGALLMLSSVSYLYTSSDVLSGSLPLLEPLIALLAVIVPCSLWLFARAVFEAPWPRAVWIVLVTLIVTCVWGVYVFDDAFSDRTTLLASTVQRIMALFVIAHALWLTVTGRPDDLIERRRSLRLFFVVIVAIEMMAIVIVELALGGTRPPTWLDLTNVVIIAALTLGLAVPMLRLRAELIGPGTGAAAARGADEADALGAAERVYRDKLLHLMDAGYYRETGLTIPVLAAELDYPEHQLRRLINGRLGYRNFSAFLNSYRLAEAKRHLADSDKARTPILTIALDLGYASLGPFNRAFKTDTGMTPTDFRSKQLGGSSADSE